MNIKTTFTLAQSVYN